MTLDRKAFIREMTLLHERFGRQPSEHVIARYYDTLNGRLDTPAFEAAARYVFDNDTYWPAPARFIDLAHGSPEAQARDEWARLIEGATRGERARLTPEGEAALMAIGGWREVAYADTDRKLPRLERAFAKRYQDAAESREVEQRSIAQLTTWGMEALDIDEAAR